MEGGGGRSRRDVRAEGMAEPSGVAVMFCRRRGAGRWRWAGWATAVLAVFTVLIASPVVTTAAASAGQITMYPGIDSPRGIAVGPDGALWFTNPSNNSIGRITTSGAVTSFTGPGVDHPSEITVGPDGALWFTNIQGNSIGRITISGAVTSFTGPGMSDPKGITAGPDGALWFTNIFGHSIGRITTGGVVTSFTDPSIGSARGPITAGPDGALWFTENDAIGRITTS